MRGRNIEIKEDNPRERENKRVKKSEKEEGRKSMRKRVNHVSIYKIR